MLQLINCSEYPTLSPSGKKFAGFSIRSVDIPCSSISNLFIKLCLPHRPFSISSLASIRACIPAAPPSPFENYLICIICVSICKNFSDSRRTGRASHAAGGVWRNLHLFVLRGTCTCFMALRLQLLSLFLFSSSRAYCDLGLGISRKPEVTPRAACRLARMGYPFLARRSCTCPV